MNYKKFVKERDEMLMKRDVNELRKFVADHVDDYGAGIARHVANAEDSWLEFVLHKTIASAMSLPEDFRAYSDAWLRERREKNEQR